MVKVHVVCNPGLKIQFNYNGLESHLQIKLLVEELDSTESLQ